MNSLFFQNGEMESSGVKTWRLVLTGGPCGGKTTAQNRLATFFESLGWRVFRVPETATILLNGGVRHCVRMPGPGGLQPTFLLSRSASAS